MASTSGSAIDSFGGSARNTGESVSTTPSNKVETKFENAGKLHEYIDKIRDEYKTDWTSIHKDKRQRGVALYLIDILCLRVGTKKGGEAVGCCSLLVKHIKLEDNQIVNFDFDGKKMVSYKNDVSVPKDVYKNLKEFIKYKQQDDNLFDDKLKANVINTHLQTYMKKGLSARVFRTYHASLLMEKRLIERTKPKFLRQEKIKVFKLANLEVGLLLNHQRTIRIGKSSHKTMQNGLSKKKEFKRLKLLPEDKIISSDTSKLSYIYPRIVVAWCKKFDVPFAGKNGIYTETQWERFGWAEDTEKDFRFIPEKN